MRLLVARQVAPGGEGRVTFFAVVRLFSSMTPCVHLNQFNKRLFILLTIIQLREDAHRQDCSSWKICIRTLRIRMALCDTTCALRTPNLKICLCEFFIGEDIPARWELVLNFLPQNSQIRAASLFGSAASAHFSVTMFRESAFEPSDFSGL